LWLLLRSVSGAASFLGCEKLPPAVWGLVRCAVEFFNLGAQVRVQSWVVPFEAVQGYAKLPLRVAGTGRHRVKKLGDEFQWETPPLAGF
jgi:hypothetical protein